jgi:hypothetical protein
VDLYRESIRVVTAHRIEWLRVLADRADEAQLIQPGRAQVINDAPDIPDNSMGRLAELRQQFTGTAGILADQDGRDFELHGEGGQRWPKPVMEIPAEPATFFFPGEDQLLPGFLQPARQESVVARLGKVAGDRFDKPPVPEGEGFGSGLRPRGGCADESAANQWHGG